MKIRDKKWSENVVTEYLSWLELGKPKKSFEINEIFLDKQMFSVENAPWYANIVNYLVKYITLPNFQVIKERNFSPTRKCYFWRIPFSTDEGQIILYNDVCLRKKHLKYWSNVTHLHMHDTLEHQWPLLKSTIRILLAFTISRCLWVCEEVWQMLRHWKYLEKEWDAPE